MVTAEAVEFRDVDRPFYAYRENASKRAPRSNAERGAMSRNGKTMRVRHCRVDAFEVGWRRTASRCPAL